MVKQTSKYGVLAMVGFTAACVGILLYLWLTFGGPIPLRAEGYRFQVEFPEAGQLTQEADVRISGVNVGRVKRKEANPQTGVTDATIELQSEFAPIPVDTTAILRQKTLLGETYVELTPGAGARSPTARPCSSIQLLNALRVSGSKARKISSSSTVGVTAPAGSVPPSASIRVPPPTPGVSST